MRWEAYAKESEIALASPQVPSSLEIINLIKKINPTKLTLSETDRERGYQLKNGLQSLLLEHYGDTFALIPHPALPSIDACHAELSSLSREAIEKVETAALHSTGDEPKRKRHKESAESATVLSPKEIVKKARALLDEYDYAAAQEVLAGLHANGAGDLQALSRGAAILLHEIGSYQCCIDLLLSQPKPALKDRGIREMLAVAYHHNGSLPEARAIFDELYPAEFGTEALIAYADIAFKDGNHTAARELVQMAKGKDGYGPKGDDLRKEIEAAMAAQAEPVARKAGSALQSSAVEQARALAREALELYPHCQEARAVIAAVEAMDEQARLAGLWTKLEDERSCERRLSLLAMLLERDKEKSALIGRLIDEEKKRQSHMLFDERLETLRNLVLQQRWPECFEAVSLLMKQQGFRERACEVLALSPHFRVLHENRRLLGTTDRSAKEVWLRFVKAKAQLAAGNLDGVLAEFEELKPWFGQYREFGEEYLTLRQGEQARARKEIAARLERCQAPDCPAAEQRSICHFVKKRMTVLPAEERRELARSIEEHLARLIPEQESIRQLEGYREAVYLGNREKVAYLRQTTADTAALAAIDAEFAAACPIALEPLTLEFSRDLPIDLTTEPPFLASYLAEHRFLLEDDDGGLVMIDFEAKAACRFTSPILKQSVLFDSTRDGSFLFVEEIKEDDPEKDGKLGDTVWRAELSTERAEITAKFSMRDAFELEDGYSMERIALSSERDTDYYLLVEHDERRHPAKLLRKRLAPRSTVETLQVGSLTEIDVWRWTSCPDGFLVGSEGEMRNVNRNLSVQGGVSVQPNIYKLDGHNGYLYGVEDIWLTKRNRKLSFVKVWKKAHCLGMFEPESVHGLSEESNTALCLMGDDRQVFYDLNTNKFSKKIRVGRVIPSYEDGKWYCFDYRREEGILRLRDITSDIHTELEWREIFITRQKTNKRAKNWAWFQERDNFVHRPDEWDVGSPE